jgi:hypothetical protein
VRPAVCALGLCIRLGCHVSVPVHYLVNAKQKGRLRSYSKQIGAIPPAPLGDDFSMPQTLYLHDKEPLQHTVNVARRTVPSPVAWVRQSQAGRSDFTRTKSSGGMGRRHTTTDSTRRLIAIVHPPPHRGRNGPPARWHIRVFTTALFCC